MKHTFLESSQPPSELNALAPLRVGGLAERLLECADNPAEVRRIAQELLELSPHLLALLVAEGEKLPDFDA